MIMTLSFFRYLPAKPLNTFLSLFFLKKRSLYESEKHQGTRIASLSSKKQRGNLSFVLIVVSVTVGEHQLWMEEELI